MSTFGQRLKYVLNEKGIKQSELATLINERRGTVSNWIYDKYQPKADKMKLIASVLGVSVAYLAGYEEEQAARADDFLNNRLIVKQKITEDSCLTIDIDKTELIKKASNMSYDQFALLLKVLDLNEKQAAKANDLLEILLKK